MKIIIIIKIIKIKMTKLIWAQKFMILIKISKSKKLINFPFKKLFKP